MNGYALVLVLGAACLHAVWNLYSKRGAVAGISFLILTNILGTVIYAPPALVQIVNVSQTFGYVEFGSILGSIALHMGYILVLQRGYAVGDLSVVYPVARGLGPVLTIAGAMLVLHERPGPQVLIGGLVVGTAVIALGLVSSSSGRVNVRAFCYAGLTGIAIASYTLWDAHAVSTLAIPPLLFTWVGSLVRLVIFTPVIWWRRKALRQVWDTHRRSVIVVATCAPLAYLLVLIALTIAPVSQVAPLRELSIIIATFFGVHLLREGHRHIRPVIAGAVLLGVILVVTGQ